MVPGLRKNGEVTVYIEVANQPEFIGENADGLASAGGKIVDRLAAVGDTVADVCNTLFARMENGIQGHTPAEFTIEFAVKLGGKAGIPMVTEGSAEGTFKVTTKWKSSGGSSSKSSSEPTS